MINFRKGSLTYQIVSLLSVVGEYPMRSIYLLGNERVCKALIHKLTFPQVFRNFLTKAEINCRLLTVSGRASSKTIKLYKSAFPILDWIGATEYYLQNFWGHKFPGDAAHRERNHRVAEAVAMFINAGLEYRPYHLPKLQNKHAASNITKQPIFYTAKSLKQVGEIELNKTIFTRIVGAVFTTVNCYAVYNTRGATMKWSGMGEFKALHSLAEIGRLNAGIAKINSALLFGYSYEIALATLLELDKSHRLEFRFDAIYNHVYFVPMTVAGDLQLQMLLIDDWREKLLNLLFEPEKRSYDRGVFEYDAIVDNVYVYSHLDGDIARLIRFRDAVVNMTGVFEVLCFPEQVIYLRKYLNRNAELKIIDPKLIQLALEIKTS